MHINCQSLSHKCTQLCTLLNRATVSVVAVTETWMNKSPADSLHIPRYSLAVCCRQDKLGGDVGFLVATGIDYK